MAEQQLVPFDRCASAEVIFTSTGGIAMSYTQIAPSVRLVVSSLLLLAGCATQAQRQFEGRRSSGRRAHSLRRHRCHVSHLNSSSISQRYL
jgi:hypothetical protein